MSTLRSIGTASSCRSGNKRSTNSFERLCVSCSVATRSSRSLVRSLCVSACKLRRCRTSSRSSGRSSPISSRFSSVPSSPPPKASNSRSSPLTYSISSCGAPHAKFTIAPAGQGSLPTSVVRGGPGCRAQGERGMMSRGMRRGTFGPRPRHRRRRASDHPRARERSAPQGAADAPAA